MEPKMYSFINAIQKEKHKKSTDIYNTKKCNVSKHNLYNYKAIKNPLVSKCSIFSFADV